MLLTMLSRKTSQSYSIQKLFQFCLGSCTYQNVVLCSPWFFLHKLFLRIWRSSFNEIRLIGSSSAHHYTSFALGICDYLFWISRILVTALKVKWNLCAYYKGRLLWCEHTYNFILIIVEDDIIIFSYFFSLL